MAMRQDRKEETAAKENRKKLGAKKLKSLQERIDEAEISNKVDLGDDLKKQFPKPASPDDVRDLKWEMQLQDTSADSAVLEVLDVEVSSNFVQLKLCWQLDETALTGHHGEHLRRYLPLFQTLLGETDVAGVDYRKVVSQLDEELVDYQLEIGKNSGFLSVGSHPYMLTLSLSAAPDKASKLVEWAEKLAYDSEFKPDKVVSTCRRIISDTKELMRQGSEVLSQVMSSAVYGALTPHVQHGAFSQKALMEQCCSDPEAACQALKDLRDVIIASSTACAAVVSGTSVDIRRDVAAKLQEAWRKRQSSSRPSFFAEFQWGKGGSFSAKPALPLKHFVVGCAGSDASYVCLTAALPQPPVALVADKSFSLSLLCEAISMMEGPLCEAVRGKGLAYGCYVHFDLYANSVSLRLEECTNVQKCVEEALDVIRKAGESDETCEGSLTNFQLDNARGSLVFSLKNKRGTPGNLVDAATISASRRFSSASDVKTWESQLAAVTRENVLVAHKEYLLRLCDPAQVVACVVCDPGECKAKAKALATCLGIDKSKVHAKESLAEGYAIIDRQINAAISTAAATTCSRCGV
eukprot:TRINITY_DN49035_c0_g1_i1.p1 TRINITY_DN49035_c0_g1~~TRINITY_DN49035_c0_g1_i1.p1  ORF type:complete len:622 (-),score=125.26 TRINITY_DN49035_c0_g1_i1:81-1817(-)